MGIQTKRKRLETTLEEENFSLLSTTEPSCFKEDETNDHWIKSMEEEVNQIEKCQTCKLVPRPKDKNVIGTKWVFKNKLNEQGQVIRNKYRLVCKGYG